MTDNPTPQDVLASTLGSAVPGARAWADLLFDALTTAGFEVTHKPKDGLTWTVTQNTPEDDYPGQWQASVWDGTYTGWAMHKNMDMAKSKAALRLRQAKEDAIYTERKRAGME